MAFRTRSNYFCNSECFLLAIFGWPAVRSEVGTVLPRFRIDINEYLNSLYSYALVLSRNRSEAEDLVQETCLRAIRAMERLRPDSNAKSWLFTILRNIWLNELRHRRTAPQMVELDPDANSANQADGAQDPLAAYLSYVEREQVRMAIRQLPVESREIILLREYEELSYQDIAIMLRCPVGTVMSRLARARSKLLALIPTTLIGARAEKKALEAPSRKLQGSSSPIPVIDFGLSYGNE
jgi:RNA polymerase sigma-70 factor, ECF subfamily